MKKIRFGLGEAVAYIIFFLASAYVIAPYLFSLYLAPKIPPSIPDTTVASILDDAIVVNALILGFVLVVLDDNVKELRSAEAEPKDFWVRFTVLVIDAAMVVISMLGLMGEMFGLVGIQTSAVSQLNKSLYLPVGFGVYVLYRFVALAFT